MSDLLIAIKEYQNRTIKNAKIILGRRCSFIWKAERITSGNYLDFHLQVRQGWFFWKQQIYSRMVAFTR